MIEYGDTMDLREKIINDVNSLTMEECAMIEKDQALFEVFVEKLSKGSFKIDLFGNMSEDLTKKIFFIEPIFYNFFEELKENDENDFLDTVFSNDLLNSLVTTENKEQALKLISDLQNKYFGDYIKMIEDKSVGIYSITNLRIIDYIIEHKLYFRASSIRLKEEAITPQIEDFFMEVLENDDEVILSSKTQKILQYCLDHNCIHRIINSLDVEKDDELQIIRDSIDNNSISFEQLKKASCYHPLKHKIPDSSSLIIQMLAYGEYLSDEQCQYVATNPELIEQIDNMMSKISDNSSTLCYVHLASFVPEIKIAFIKHDLECFGSYERDRYGSTFEKYYNRDYKELLRLYNEKKEYFIKSVTFFLNNHVNRSASIAEILLLDDNFKELSDVVFKKLPSVDYAHLLIKYSSLVTASVRKLDKLIEYIDANHIDLSLDNVEALNDIKNFTAYIRLLKSLTIEQVESKSFTLFKSLYTFTNLFSTDEMKEIMGTIIDLVVKNKSSYLNDKLDAVIQYADFQDIQKLIDVVEELNMSFDEIYKLRQYNFTENASYDELVDMFKSASSISFSSFNIIITYYQYYLLSKDNIHFIKWMLDSPVLVVDSNLFNTLNNMLELLDDASLGEVTREMLKEFYCRVGNVPAKNTYSFDKDTIIKSTLDCDDDYYTTNVSHFKLGNNTYGHTDTYFELLFQRIKERLLAKKDVSFELFVYCAENKKDISSEEYTTLLNSGHLLWKNIDDNIKYISKHLKDNEFDSYIRQNFISNMNASYIDSETKFDELINYNPDFINRLKQLAANKASFNWNILKLVKYADDNIILEFLNNIYDNDLINYGAIDDDFFSLNHPLIDKAIKNKVITNSYLLEKFTFKILDKDSQFEPFVVDQLRYQDNISGSFVFESMVKYELYFKAIANAFKEKRMSFSNINVHYFNPTLLTAILENDFDKINDLVTYLIHSFNNPSKEAMDVLIPYICKYRNYDVDNFKYLYGIYGNTIIPLLENENFQYLCNQDRKAIERVVKLLEPRTLDKMMIEGINNSIRQNIFSSKNPKIINVFTTLVTLIQNDELVGEVRQHYLNELHSAVPDGIENDILKTGDERLLQLYNTDKLLFLDYLFDCIKKNQNIYGNILKDVTNNYISIKRNDFAAQDDIFTDTNIKFVYDEKSLYDNLFKDLLAFNIRGLLKYLDLDRKFLNYDPNYHDFGDQLIDYHTLQFLRGKSYDDFGKEFLVKIKKNIGVLKARFIKNVKENTLGDVLPSDLMYKLHEPDFESKIKKVLILNKRERNLNTEMTNLNVKVLLLNVVNDEEKYKALLDVINKFRLLDWGNLFQPGISQLSIASEVENLYSFLNAFNQIYEAEKKNITKYKLPIVLEEIERMHLRGASEKEIEKYKEKELAVQFSAYKILKYCSIFSSIPNCYKILLGLEDYEIVKRNENPNASGWGVLDRMKRASEVYLKAIKQQEISIPSIISDQEVSSNKKLRVIVGNRFHPRNLSHGERTGACMRALGHADNLFEFAASDFNGFHITFVDPETDEYVSRVSGFRNGNTVFLNQLRYVVKENHKYTNEDVIEAMKLVAQELIEMSKDSDFPIENVVASKSYALEIYETQKLSDDNIGAGVYTGYKDVNSNAVVLATTGEGGKAVPLEIATPSRHPHYKCVRIYPVEVKGNLTDRDKIKLQRITAIKKILEHEDDPTFFESIDIDVAALEEEYEYTLIGQDWFIALNSKLEIISDIITIDERAQVEFDEAMKRIVSLKEKIIEEQTLIDTVDDGGLKNG